MKVFDLFAGCGGFRLAFERAGFEFVGFCEIDKHASRLYKAFFNTDNEVYFNDARTINTREMPDFDVLVGGFPCQSFSIAGQRRGFDDPRGELIFEIARILRDKKPPYFLLENVKGLLSSGGGADFQEIIKLLADCGDYAIEWAVLNSKDYGVAQNRERVYIVGFPRAKRPGQIFPLGIGESKGNERGTAQKGICETALCLTKSGQNNCNGSHIVIGTLRTHNDGKGFRPSKKTLSGNPRTCKN